MVDRGLLTADNWSYSGTGAAWKGRLWFFLGLALSIGSLGGAIVRDMWLMRGLNDVHLYANGDPFRPCLA